MQESYRKWIIRLRNEKVFNLYECEAFLSKFGNERDLENGVRIFSAFENQQTLTLTNQDNKSDKNKKGNNNTDILMQEEFWVEVEAKASTDEGATSLRKDISFSDKIVNVLKSLISNDDKITDKKLIIYIIKILFNVLTKGKFESQNIDITKNQNILNIAMQVFKISQNDDSLHALLNDIIKVIGLFAKFYCYYSSGIDLSFCSGFLRYMPNIITNPTKPSNVHINLIKAVGIMITAANMAPKRSLIFYKSFLDFNIINVLLCIVKNHKNVNFKNFKNF
jgi:hypothetical protein